MSLATIGDAAPDHPAATKERRIGSGMRALDICCGADDVTMLAAGLLGPSGRVIATDRDAIAINAAWQPANDVRRSARLGLFAFEVSSRHLHSS